MTYFLIKYGNANHDPVHQHEPTDPKRQFLNATFLMSKKLLNMLKKVAPKIAF